jgi:hypothetical protein
LEPKAKNQVTILLIVCIVELSIKFYDSTKIMTIIAVKRLLIRDSVEKTIGPTVVTFKKPNQIYTINEHSAAFSYKIVADVYGRPHCVAKLILGM